MVGHSRQRSDRIVGSTIRFISPRPVRKKVGHTGHSRQTVQKEQWNNRQLKARWRRLRQRRTVFGMKVIQRRSLILQAVGIHSDGTERVILWSKYRQISLSKSEMRTYGCFGYRYSSPVRKETDGQCKDTWMNSHQITLWNTDFELQILNYQFGTDKN